MRNKKTGGTVAFLITLTVLMVGTALLFVLLGNHPTEKHRFGAWQTVGEPSEFTCGERVRTCKDCDYEEHERLNATAAMAQFYLTTDDGAEIASGQTSIGKAAYIDRNGKEVFSLYMKAILQGHYTLRFGKKSYTVKLYLDEGLREKAQLRLFGDEPQYRYTLHANYIDVTAARNLTCNRVWEAVTKSRPGLPKAVAAMDHAGAVDGTPVLLFVNNRLAGLYTFDLPKDEVTYGITEKPKEAMFVINTDEAECAHFRATVKDGELRSVFDQEYPDPEKTVWPLNSVNRLLDFVVTHEGEAFREGIAEYLDVDSSLDYLITSWALGLTDNFNKNAILWTFDGQKWIFGLYDMDTAGGLSPDGETVYPAEALLPRKDAGGQWTTGTDNLLWDRLLTAFPEKLTARYEALRADCLSTDNILSVFNEITGLIPENCYKAELALRTDSLPCYAAGKEQFRDYLTQHTALLDDAMNRLKEDLV